MLEEQAVDISRLNEGDDTGSLGKSLASSHMVIDAVLGIGRSRPLGGAIRACLEAVQQEKRRNPGLAILSLDVPSGLDADDGSCDAATPYADVTVTLGYPKQGLFHFQAVGKVGKLVTVDIGIPAVLADQVSLEVASDSWVKGVLPARPLHANKGTFGRVMVVAGSADYIGAAYLACAGAIRSGAGLVTLATPKSLVPVIAAQLPEVTYLPLQESDWGVVKGADSARQVHRALPAYDVLLAGCGVSQHPRAADMVRHLLTSMPSGLHPRLVVDADGLNILAKSANWWLRIHEDAVITPHPGEMRRLTGATSEDVQANRLAAARKAASTWRKTVLLKGAYSLVVVPEGQAVIIPFANPALATAGTGDVLAGIVAGFLAQGLSSFDAAAAAAYVHGVAGERLRDELGDAGAAASDLLPLVPRVLKDLRAG
jgi:NAD(P)H-hydrate epimerase